MALRSGNHRAAILKSKHLHRADSTVYVSVKSPFSGLVTKVEKAAKRGKVRIIGTGRAVQQTLQLTAKLKSENYDTKIYTFSFKTVEDLKNDEEIKLVERTIPGIEIIATRRK